MKKALLLLTLALLLGGWGCRNRGPVAGPGNGQPPKPCTEEAKVCSDGSAVGRVAPACDFAPCPKEDLIKVEAPQAYAAVKSPLTIRGQARGNWYFEATFPVQLLDGQGRVLASHYAQAVGDWMTAEFVPFESTLSFAAPLTATGTLVLKKDNPSGLPEHDDELRVPVTFAPVATRKIKLYYYKPAADQDRFGNVKCSRDGLVAVEREIQLSQTPIQDAVKLLLLGQPTSAERARGITTEYPLAGLALKGASLKEGKLALEFSDPENKTGGGACRAGILWFQIEATAKQFSEVSEVRFLPEELFQP